MTDQGKEIGRRIAEIRARAGIAAKDVAKALGISESSYYAIEDGRNTRSFAKLANLAEVLGTTPNAVLGYGPDRPPASIDQLEMMGAAVQKMLMDAEPDRWPRERAEALVDIATEVAIEKSELDLDRRLAAAFLKHALKPPT